MGALPVAVFLGLYCLSFSSQKRGLTLLFEAVSIFLFAYAVLSSLLSLFDLYSHVLVATLLDAGLLLRLHARSDGIDWQISRSIRFKRETLAFLLVAVIFLAFTAERFEHIAMTHDVSVYCNSAKNLVKWGGTRYYIQPSDKLSPLMSDLADVPQRLPGTYPLPEGDAYYQFFPGWPSILALGMHLFGPLEYRYVMVAIAIAVLYWIFMILGQWLVGWQRIGATFALALNPLLIYFTKYTTSELFLLLCVLFTLYAFVAGGQQEQSLSLLAIAAIAVSHISIFLYLPMLFLHGGLAAFSGDRALFTHFRAVSLIFVASLGLGFYFSPQYYVDIFSIVGFLAKLDLPLKHLWIPVGAALSTSLFYAAARWFLERRLRDQTP